MEICSRRKEKTIPSSCRTYECFNSRLHLGSLETLVVLSSWWEIVLPSQTGTSDSSFRHLNAMSLAVLT